MNFLFGYNIAGGLGNNFLSEPSSEELGISSIAKKDF